MKKLTKLAALSISLTVAGVAGCGPDCDTIDGVTACGALKSVTYSTELSGSWDNSVAWPPVALADGRLLLSRGTQILEIGADGSQRVVVEANGQLSPVSQGQDGSVMAVATSLDGASTLHSYSLEGGQLVNLRQAAVPGSATGSPVTIGNNSLVANNASGTLRTPTQVRVDSTTLQPIETREGASRVVVLEDDSTRHLDGARDCGASFEDVVAEDRFGNEMWRHAEPSGVRDFAPDRNGNLYLVTGDRRLVKVNGAGSVEWAFLPECANCNVAGAPTVTDDAIYFPAWEGTPPPSGCEEPGMGAPEEEPIDPLFALSHDGLLQWQYDGFTTDTNRQPSMASVLLPSGIEITVHHPAGRPSVANDGTLFVAADGSVVALDKRGEEIGRMIIDASAGEQQSIGAFGGSSENIAGDRPSAVLGPNGTLFTWDGATLRAIDTGKPAANTPWTAPFGGFRNDGRVGN